MGMTNFSGSKPRKKEVSIAKNYLNKDEIYLLNGLVSSYLEFAELQAKRRKVMSMKDWIKKLDDFLTFSDFEVLRHKGKISHKQALNKANLELLVKFILLNRKINFILKMGMFYGLKFLIKFILYFIYLFKTRFIRKQLFG